MGVFGKHQRAAVGKARWPRPPRFPRSDDHPPARDDIGCRVKAQSESPPNHHLMSGFGGHGRVLVRVADRFPDDCGLVAVRSFGRRGTVFNLLLALSQSPPVLPYRRPGSCRSKSLRKDNRRRPAAPRPEKRRAPACPRHGRDRAALLGRGGHNITQRASRGRPVGS